MNSKPRIKPLHRLAGFNPLPLVVILLFCASSCGGGESPTLATGQDTIDRGGKKIHSPELYKDYLNQVNEKVSAEMETLVNQIAEGSTRDIEVKYENLKKLIEQSKAEIEGLGDFENDPKLKEEAVKTLAVYDSTVNEDLSQMIAILKKGNAITASDSLHLRRMAIHISTELQNQDIKYQNSQDNFQQQYQAPLPRPEVKDSLSRRR